MTFVPNAFEEHFHEENEGKAELPEPQQFLVLLNRGMLGCSVQMCMCSTGGAEMRARQLTKDGATYR